MTTQLKAIDLVTPGFRGLNTTKSGSILPPTYCTVASNAVIDHTGRLAARGGHTTLTTTPITSTPDVKTIFDYLKKDGTIEQIVAWDGGIGNDLLDPEGNDISGSVTDTNGRWWFLNFVDNVYGFQDGLAPIVYNGTGTFETLTATSGTMPTSHRGIAAAAFGRLWIAGADGQSIFYSGLLSPTKYETDDLGAGSLDMTSIWTNGMDEITAIYPYNGQLIVFGKRHIMFWTDGSGSELGIDPSTMMINDVIEGTGCLTQFSIQHVGEADLLYLSPNSVQSMSRVLTGATNPISTITKNVRHHILARVEVETDMDSISSTYDPFNGYYLLTFPTEGNNPGITYCIDQRYPYQDEDGQSLNVVTTWTLAPDCWFTREDYTVYVGSSLGIGKHLFNTADDAGVTFRFTYESPWLDLGEDLANRIKILKRFGSIMSMVAETSIVFKWAVDFSSEYQTLTRTVSAQSPSEWGADSAQWNVSEWGGGLALRIIKLPARRNGRGQYFKLAVDAVVSGQFSIQQLELLTKIGRLA